MTWVDVVPQILDRIHDTPGEAGHSPYQILFGRDRLLAGVPYQPPVVCEDAKVFFERQKVIDRAVAKLLNEKHLKKEAWLNQKRVEQPPFLVGDVVWYYRPPRHSDKLSSKWLGPAKVVAREGADSYQIEVKPGKVIASPRNFLKAYTQDKFSETPMELFFHRRTPVDLEGAPDEYVLEKILGHKEVDGKMYFEVKWEGREDPTLEPAGNFFQRFSAPLIEYGREHGVNMNIFEELTGRGVQE